MQLCTARLVLRPLTRDDAAAVAAGDRTGRPWSPGFPRDDDMDAARMLLAAADAPGARDLAYGAYVLVLRASGLVVGTAGFFGPPGAEGRVEIGYGLVPEVRGRGLPTEVVDALVSLARQDPRVGVVVASTDPDNLASQRVLDKSGFVRVPGGEPRSYVLELSS